MPTVTKTIGSAGGRDYSTLAAWAAALPANLVTDGNSQQGECYNDSEFTSGSTLLTLSGHTTDSTHTITVTTGAGQSFRDNASVQSNPLKYDASKGVGIRSTSSYTKVIDLADSYVTLSNLQIKSLSAAAIDSSGGNNLQVNNCCVVVGGSGNYAAHFSGGSAPIATLRNSVFYVEGAAPGDGIVDSQQSIALYFCTVAQPSDVAASGLGIHCNYGTLTLENCGVFGVTTAVSASTPAYTTCMTDQASPPTGFSQVTYTSQFQGTTAAAIDFRVKVGADLIDAGTSDSTNGATDIAGTARPSGSAYDIGCWEFIAAAAASNWGYEVEPAFPRRRKPRPLRLNEDPAWPFTATATPTQFGWATPEQFAKRRRPQTVSWQDVPVFPVSIVSLTPTQFGFGWEPQFPIRRKPRNFQPDEPTDQWPFTATPTPTQQGFAWEPQFPIRRKRQVLQPDQPAEMWPFTVTAPTVRVPANAIPPVPERAPAGNWEPWLVQIARTLNLVLRGKVNAVTSMTLTANATSTTLIDDRIGANTFLALVPLTQNATILDLAPYVSDRTRGSATIAHGSSPATDLEFSVLLIG